jgi:hypothetical protein
MHNDRLASYQTFLTQILLLQLLVDRNCCLGSFGSGNDDELHIPRGIACDIQSGHSCSFMAIGSDRPGACECTTKLAGKAAALILTGREEKGAPWKGVPVVKDYPFENSLLSFQPYDPFGADDDTMTGQTGESIGIDTGTAIGAEYDIVAPGLQRKRQCKPCLPPTIDSQWLVTHLPSIAVGAVVNGRTVESVDAFDVRKAITHTGCDEEFAGSECSIVDKCQSEASFREGPGARHLLGTERNAILLQILSTEFKEFTGIDSVA